MDKITRVLIIAGMVSIAAGCSTTPPPTNINIGGGQIDGCTPSSVTLNIMTDSAISNEGLANAGKADKQLTGGELSDQDSVFTEPTLGL